MQKRGGIRSYDRSPVRPHHAWGVFLLIGLLAGCGETGPAEPQHTGTLRAVTTSAGADFPHPGHYTLAVAGAPQHPIGLNATVDVPGLPAGSREVELRGLTNNCAVSGANPRTLDIRAGGTAEAHFEVRCTPRRIAFHSNRTGVFNLYLMNPDGTGVTALTEGSSIDQQPAWSPDYTRIAFASFRGGQWDIYVIDADGSNLRRLTSSPADDNHPAWSPDGSRIAFTSRRDGDREQVFVMNADGSNQRNLSNSPGHAGLPSWSPDGSRIAFTTIRNGNQHLYVMDADGSNQRLLSGLRLSFRPRWSPDGSRIVLSSAEARAPAQIWVLNADGTQPARLTNTPDLINAHPEWSPDGSSIIFFQGAAGSQHLYVMDADGSNQRRLSHHSRVDEWPSWTPAGARAYNPR